MKRGFRAIASAGVRKQGSPEKLTVNDLMQIGSITKGDDVHHAGDLGGG